jgi:myo-inositol catabolism protein IolS
MNSSLASVQIGSSTKHHAPLGMGCSFYGVSEWGGQQTDAILEAMATALDNDITHFDTAEGYGGGESERLIGQFLSADKSRRDKILLASKANLNDISKQAMLDAIDASLYRLETDVIDLYYIHWPRTGQDMRPMMEGLETARQQGKIKAIGVSNFSVDHMKQVSEVGTIDAHQLGYSLLWRFPERDLIPYCVENNIAVVVYSALAHGILAGKYQRDLTFDADDQRWSILHFRDDVWANVYQNMTDFNAVANRINKPLSHLAIRWLLQQEGVTSVLVSAKNPTQALSNATALQGDMDLSIWDELTAISDEAMQHIPDDGNPFGYHP